MLEPTWHAVLSILVLWGASASPCTAAEPHEKPPPKPRFHVYLLMGQSNMAGRGRMTEADRRPVERVWMLDKENRWVPAAHPLHFDKPKIAGVGVGIAFAKRMNAEDPAIQIGLVPCAVGGTPLSRWSEGGDLYQNAVARAKVAMQRGTLKGVLWHQGESDTGTPENANTYGERLARMIGDLRAELGSPKLPFVAGRLGEFYVRAKKRPGVVTVDAALAALPKRVERTGCASAEGLDHKGDVVHFDADALREFGRRYAAEMLRVQGEGSRETGVGSGE
jgi:hypothetical protein